MQCIIEQYENEYAISLKLCSKGDKMYISSSYSEFFDENFPSIFINVEKKRRKVEFTTLELMKLNERMNESLEEIYLMSDEIVYEMVEDIRDTQILHDSSECISQIDMIWSFAQYAKQSPTSIRGN
jgi:DNA mismatch repair ATPase MutS